MKKPIRKVVLRILLTIVVIICGYLIYSWNRINSLDTIVLINNQLQKNEVDAFFDLAQGTYDPNKHTILFSFLRKNPTQQNTYFNLDSRLENGYLNNAQFFDCHMDFSEYNYYKFKKNQFESITIIARIITNDAGQIMKLNSQKMLGEKELDARLEFGKINLIDVNRNGTFQNCQKDF